MGATIGGQFRLARSDQVVVPPSRPPCRWRIQSAEDVEQCRFSRAGRPEQDDELARRYVQIEPAQSMHGGLAAPVGLVKTAGYEHRVRLLNGRLGESRPH